jgi:large subunit ribosomal protein L22
VISKASVRFVRITPRKVRYVIDRIRRKSVFEAQGILNGSPRRAAEIVRKLLNQAVDAAEKNSQAKPQTLFISKIMADGGPTMKRFRAASMGRGMVIRKRTSHIYLELDSKTPVATAKREKPTAALQTKGVSKKAVSKKLVGAK